MSKNALARGAVPHMRAAFSVAWPCSELAPRSRPATGLISVSGAPIRTASRSDRRFRHSKLVASQPSYQPIQSRPRC